ncbi:MAG: DUF1929 domain-containing protein [Thermoleophilaceae bacterium]|nr:DUF1929 domain-containing protein [Thermoleophilaceae bacterium]
MSTYLAKYRAGALFAAALLACLVASTGASAHGSDAAMSGSDHRAADAMTLTAPQLTRNAQRIKRRNRHVRRADLKAKHIRELGMLRQLGLASVGTSANTGRAHIADLPDYGQVGSWSAVLSADVPAVPVFTALLPNGKILAWDWMLTADPSTHHHRDTRAMVWDPVTQTAVRVDLVGPDGANLFCAGYTHLPNGDIFVAGGNLDDLNTGIKNTYVFHWQTYTWERGPDMSGARWYPSVAALSNGEELMVSGGPTFAEARETSGAIRQLSGIVTNSSRLYPFLAPSVDGRVLYAGTEQQMSLLNTEGTGGKEPFGIRDTTPRTYGSFSTLGGGKIIVNGGGSGDQRGATNTGSAINLTRGGGESATPAQGTPTAAPIANMAYPRRQHYLTALPDGSVLATGGMGLTPDPYVEGSELVNLNNPVKAAELFDPATDSWKTLASANRIREYHSMASLLPDGRVITGGGGTCGVCITLGYEEKNFEIFTPPYLYKHDGSGTLATRPTISSAPATADYDTQFSVSSPSAGSITKVSLMRLGAATHSVDQGQRMVPLNFSANAGTLTVTAPPNAYEAPPGYYMLFIVDDQGVPSVSTMLKLGNGDSTFGSNTAPLTAASGQNLGGTAQRFGIGNFSAERGNFATVGNNAIRSLSVAAGYSATVCTAIAGGGDCTTIGPGDHPTAAAAFDQTISYIRVVRAPGQPADAGSPIGGYQPPVTPMPRPARSTPTIKLAKSLKLRHSYSIDVNCSATCAVTAELIQGKAHSLKTTLTLSGSTVVRVTIHLNDKIFALAKRNIKRHRVTQLKILATSKTGGSSLHAAATGRLYAN